MRTRLHSPPCSQPFAMGVKKGQTPMARAVLTLAPEGLIVRRPIHSISVEQVAQKALATTMMAALVALPRVMIGTAALIIEHAAPSTARLASRLIDGTPLYDLVEFATVEPNAATLWAIVDLNALPLTHDEISSAGGAKKPLFLGIIRHCRYLTVTCRLFRLEGPAGAQAFVSIGRSLLDTRH